MKCSNVILGTLVSLTLGVAPGLAINVNQNLAIMVTDLEIVGGSQELQELVKGQIKTKIGKEATLDQLNQDVSHLFKLGLVSNAQVATMANPLGMKVSLSIEPIRVTGLNYEGNKVLPSEILNQEIGQELSRINIAKKVNQWYQNQGYLAAEVLSIDSDRHGIVNIRVSEPEIGKINLLFVNDANESVKGRTKESIIRKVLKLQPGQIFNQNQAQLDLKELQKLGLFDKAEIALVSQGDKIDVTYKLKETPTRAFNLGGGYEDRNGLFGTISYNDRNLMGTQQQIGGTAQISGKDIQFNGGFTSPNGISVNGFRQGGNLSDGLNDVRLANGDRPLERKVGGGITYSRPVGGVQTSVGLNYSRNSIRDDDGKLTPVDRSQNALTVSSTGIDDLLTVKAGIGMDNRDNMINPNSGNRFRVTTLQSLPVGNGAIAMNQIQGDYSQFIPLPSFNKQPQTLALNLQGGTTLGTLPPYQAYSLGGSNSVRGYNPGELATARSYVLATAEYRMSFTNNIGGVVFADFGSSLGTNTTFATNKPGTGLGYGAGLRYLSPVGMLRLDYGLNTSGDNRVQFGLGHRF